MRLTQELDPDEIVARLGKVMHEGIKARDCMLLPEHAPKAMTVITAARYRLRLRSTEAFPEDLGSGLTEFLSRSEILVTKSTKKGDTTVDLIPLIHGWTVGEDGNLEILLHAGSRDHVKPALLYEAFLGSLGLAFQPQMLAVHRLDLYESPAEGEFVPLIPKAV
jgi:radical SAM-linked protein